MRKFVLLVLLSLVITNADPFFTVSGYTLPKGMVMVGPSVMATIPLENSIAFEADPSLWLGYGIIPRMDATVMLQSSYRENRSEGSDFRMDCLMAEARYDVAGKERFALSPALDFFVPLYADRDSTGEVQRDPLALGPGLMSTLQFGKFKAHGNLLSYIPLDGSFFEVDVLLSPEYYFWPSFSAYIDYNCSFGYAPSTVDYELAGISLEADIWLGVSWSPVDWMSINAVAKFKSYNWIKPGISAYFFF